jgi:TRAP transporter TAXI family solute receptor
MKMMIGLLVFFLTLAIIPPVQAQRVISIGTAPAGGAWYGIGGALADVITKEVEGMKAIAEVTGAAIENVKLIGTKKIEIGFTINDIAKQGYEGGAPFKEKYPNLRTLVSSIQKGSLQIVALKGAGLEYVSDLRGKRVAVGPAGHGSLKNLQEIFEVLGFTFSDIKPVYLPYEQSLTALGDKKVDAAVIYVAPPAPAIKEFAVTHNVKLLGLKEENLKALLQKYPNYIGDSLAKSLYKGMENDVLTVSTANVILVEAGLPEDLVYKITAAIFKNIEKIRSSHPSAKGFSLQVATKGASVPFHPGAIRYFKEQKVWTQN